MSKEALDQLARTLVEHMKAGFVRRRGAAEAIRHGGFIGDLAAELRVIELGDLAQEVIDGLLSGSPDAASAAHWAGILRSRVEALETMLYKGGLNGLKEAGIRIRLGATYEIEARIKEALAKEEGV